MEEWGFSAGDEVELRGLSKVELNGQRGTVLPLESLEQARALGRLAVMLNSGRQLSIKSENLLKVPPPERTRTGGDRGDEWNALLQKHGKAIGLPLTRYVKAQETAKTDLVVMTLNLHCLADFPEDEEVGKMRVREIVSMSPQPDVICVQEGLEGVNVFGAAGYVKLISSEAKAQTAREMVYDDPVGLEAVPVASHGRLVVNELYMRYQGTEWEVVETGVEQISSDVVLGRAGTGVSGPIAVRSAAWVRLRSRLAQEGPFALVINTQITGGPFEDQFFVGQLAEERRLQSERLLEVFSLRGSEGDLGIIVGDFRAAAEDAADGYVHNYFETCIRNMGRVRDDAASTNAPIEDLEPRLRDYMHSPFATLRKNGWKLAYSHANIGATSQSGILVDHMAISRDVPVLAEVVPTTNPRGPSAKAVTHTPISDHNAVKASFSIPRPGAETRPIPQRDGPTELPSFGFGTCFLPEDLKERVPDHEYRNKVQELTEECVRVAVEAGVRLFDCANSNINQKAVGRALARAVSDGLVARSELFIAGRIWRCKDREEVRREMELMFRELQVDYVDLLTMEVPAERCPRAWRWLEEVYREGGARHLGVCSFDLLGPKVCVQKFREFLANTEIQPAVCCMEVHPFNVNEEMCECCRGLDIRVMAASPLGAPHKIESFMKVLTKSDARDLRPMLKVPENPVLREVGRHHGVSGAQAALRWGLQRGHCVVPKSFDRRHVAENAELFHFALSPDDVAAITGLHKGVRAERFSQQAHSNGSKSLPKMTREAQDACEKILRTIRGKHDTEDDKRKAEIDEFLASHPQPSKGGR